MKHLARTVVVLILAGTALGGCGPHLAKLGVCSSGPYRYANAKGVSLPSLSVPTPEDLNSLPQSPLDVGAGTNVPPPPPPAALAPASPPTQSLGGAQSATPPADSQAPVATPPKQGAMVLPRGAASFGSC